MNNLINALTIEERYEIFLDKNIEIYDDPLIIEEKWNNVKGLWKESDLDFKLSSYGIKKEEFAFLLKDYTEYEKKILEHGLQKFNWYFLCKEVMTNEISNRNKHYPIIIPFIENLKKQLYNLKTKNITISKHVYDSLICSIEKQFEILVSKSVILDMEKYKKNNIFQTSNKEEQFYEYLNKNFSDINSVFRFYDVYPVLLRTIAEKTINFQEFIDEMIKNLDSYYCKYSEFFSLLSNDIIEIKLSIGDAHNNDKSVTKITFANQCSFVYKPRYSYLSRSFLEFCEFYNLNSGLLDLYIEKIYYEHNFALEEFVDISECETLSQVRDFYYRYGELLAIVGVLQGSDIHSENLIAKGEYPVIIDHETFMTQAPRYDFTKSYQITGELFNLSTTGLLPMKALNNNIKGEGIEISALAGGKIAILPKKMFVLKDKNTIDMRYEYSNVKKGEDKNRPYFQGSCVNFEDYRHEIIQGFKDCMLFFYKNKNYAAKTVYDLFKDKLSRVIVKPTAVYTELLLFYNHPDYLKNMIHVERLLDNMWAYPQVKKRIIISEIKEMLKLQIPIFYSNTSGKKLYSNYGTINNYYEISPINNIVSRIISITSENLNYEIEKLSILLGFYKDIAENHILTLHKKNEKNLIGNLRSADIIELCKDIADTILDNKICIEGKINWKIVNLDNKYPLLELTTNSLYDGNIGIFLFLHYYMKITGYKDSNTVLNAILENINIESKFCPESLFDRDASFFIIKYLEGSNKSFDDSIMQFYEKKKFRFFGGWLDSITGHIQFLANLYVKDYWRENILFLLMHLNSEVKRLLKEEKILFDSRSLGLGHGEIGAILSLIKLENILREDYSETKEKLLKTIENKVSSANDNRISNSWCHGYGGLGIGALECLKFSHNKRFDKFIEIALNKIRTVQSINMCLCHGGMGDIEFLLSYWKRYHDKDVYDILYNRVADSVFFYKKYKNLLVMETPLFRNYGLFTGSAGIGYELLRVLMIKNDEIGNILLLDF